MIGGNAGEMICRCVHIPRYNGSCFSTYLGKNGSIFFIYFAGDYLSFERGQQVLSSQSDGVTKADRLEGLVMAMADFHVQMNFLKMGFKMLFHVSCLHDSLLL